MKAVHLSILAFAALSAAQLPPLPDCAKPCANTLPPECNLDVGCICKSQSFISSISCCVKTKCSDADQKKTQQVAQQLCDTANVKLPTTASCPGSSGTTSSTSSMMASSSTAGAAGAVATGTNTSNGTMAGSSTSMGASTGTAAGVTSTGSSSATGSSSGSATGTSSAAASTSNAAAVLEAFGSGIGALGAAVAALVLL